MSRSSSARRPSRNQLRIIGGKWRGRKLDFPSVEGLRPTGDRIRETLFNWLNPWVEGARCLDLFAGSGALALEALSRGAGRAVMLDADRRVVEQLRSHCQQLGADNAVVLQRDAMQWLVEPGSAAEQGQAGGFDLVFLDPPFQAELLDRAARLLTDSGALVEDALIYVERDRRQTFAPPAGWRLLKHKSAGQVNFALYRLERG